jgi:hypothetical protein
MKTEIDQIYEEIDILWKNINHCRGYFPCVSDESVGAKVLLTPPYYQDQGINIIHSFEDPLTVEKKNEINEVGHWINQNFIIRLCALMESFHMLSKGIDINFHLNGSEHLNIVRRLRNRFAHSSGRFNPDDKEDLKTMKLMRDNLNISIDGRTDWPLAISTVIEKLLEGCRLYVKEKLSGA